MKFTRAQLLTIVRREISMRKEVFGKKVYSGKMSQGVMDYQVKGMEAVEMILNNDIDQNKVVEIP